MTTAAQKFVERRYPEADVMDPNEQCGAFVVIDDAESAHPRIIGQGATEAEAWANTARSLGSKR